ncbi:ATP-binding cassette domain-containing protein [Bauldia sp.]|uniref:ATP-binding cassette domain-containing protein n=1 Tax=Bauldia sp. TaxID=2575872 RepID=UPI003BAACE01
MSLVSVSAVSVNYGDVRVLENVSLDVDAGAFVTMVGASGCGKSTFLRLLLSQEAPTRGSITIGGAPIPDRPTPDRGIVFQRYSVFPHLTVFENLTLPLELERAPLTGRLGRRGRRELGSLVDEIVERIGLGAARDRYPAQLSGGMQQRLAIAQTLLKKPKLLLLDEPFGALDPGIRRDMHDLLLGLWSDIGMTVLMVTHDIAEAFKLGTRLIVFDKIRHDPDAPFAYGATITYDLPLKHPTDTDGTTVDPRSAAAALDETVLKLTKGNPIDKGDPQ